MAIKIKIGQKKKEYYKGLLVEADNKVHDQALEILKEYLHRGKKIIDLGSGEGAFSLRMRESGYLVTAVDNLPDKFKLKDKVEFIKLDLDNNIELENFLASYKNIFDCVTAIEVIEHLQNPWKFLLFCKDLLKPEGFLLISTPNISSFISRIIFLFLGKFHQFRDGDLEYGHINPLTSFELELIFSKLRFKVAFKKPAGTLPLFWVDSNWKMMVVKLLGLIFYPLMQGDKNGWCLMYLLQKGKND